jgi:hypothetical protein
MHTTVAIERLGPPDTYPRIQPQGRGVSPLATGVAGAVLGALAGAGYVASRKLSTSDELLPDGGTKDDRHGDL